MGGGGRHPPHPAATAMCAHPSHHPPPPHTHQVHTLPWPLVCTLVVVNYLNPLRSAKFCVHFESNLPCLETIRRVSATRGGCVDLWGSTHGTKLPPHALPPTLPSLTTSSNSAVLHRFARGDQIVQHPMAKHTTKVRLSLLPIVFWSLFLSFSLSLHLSARLTLVFVRVTADSDEW